MQNFADLIQANVYHFHFLDLLRSVVESRVDNFALDELGNFAGNAKTRAICICLMWECVDENKSGDVFFKILWEGGGNYFLLFGFCNKKTKKAFFYENLKTSYFSKPRRGWISPWFPYPN